MRGRERERVVKRKVKRARQNKRRKDGGAEGKIPISLLAVTPGYSHYTWFYLPFWRHKARGRENTRDRKGEMGREEG